MPSRCPISSAIALNATASGASRETSIATRRSAACSCASRATSERASALAMLWPPAAGIMAPLVYEEPMSSIVAEGYNAFETKKAPTGS